jgi:hypothetical protein
MYIESSWDHYAIASLAMGDTSGISTRHQITDETKANPAAEQQTKLQNQANMLYRKILALINIQHLYIPGLYSYQCPGDFDRRSQAIFSFINLSVGLNIYCNICLLHIKLELY